MKTNSQHFDEISFNFEDKLNKLLKKSNNKEYILRRTEKFINFMFRALESDIENGY